MLSKTRIRENAALLLVWSVFALVEGTLRMVINSKPSADVDYFTNRDGTVIPVAVLLAGGVAEVIFGIAGIYVGIFSLFLNKNNVLVTKVLLVVQFFFGWFVFLTYVVAAPILSAKNAQGNGLLSQKEQRSLIIMGHMLGSICFCWALQGGQFIMILRLVQSQEGKDDDKAKNALRGMVWSGNMVAAAISTLFVGALLSSKGFTSTTGPVGAAPHVVWRPWLSLITGIIMFAYGVAGFVAPKIKKMADTMPVLFIVTTTAMMINFSWTFGIVPGLAPPIPGAAQHIGLVLAMTILPLFHSQRAHVLVEDEEDKDCDKNSEITPPEEEMAQEMSMIVPRGDEDDKMYA